MDETGQTR